MSRKNGGIIGPVNTPVGGLLTGVAGGVWRMNDVANFVGNSQWPIGPQNIDNSLRFNDGSSDNLTRTATTPTDNKKQTTSVWVKRSALSGSSNFGIMGFVDTSAPSNSRFHLYFYNDQLAAFYKDPTITRLDLKTNRLFRDTSAWYHIVLAIDTTEGTASDRTKLYVNGVQETSFSSSDYPVQNTTFLDSGETLQVGRLTTSDGSQQYYDGYIAEAVFIDGQALTPSSFGETDSTTGIWKPKKFGKFGGTVGANTFYLDFKDSSNVGKDASGLSNNFTVNNLTSIDQSTDTCVENYDTLVPLMAGTSSLTYSEGNLKIVFGASGTWYFTTSTIGVTQGKWYCEVKIDAVGGETSVGIIPMETVALQQNAASDYMGKESDSIGYVNNGQLYKTNSVQETTSSYTTNDIIGIAFNLDGNSIQFYKNGSSVGSAITLTSGLTYAVGVSGYNSSTQSVNFGNPSFSISSGNSDANGFGNFEYSVPSGYYALNTSNLNTYG